MSASTGWKSATRGRQRGEHEQQDATPAYQWAGDPPPVTPAGTLLETRLKGPEPGGETGQRRQSPVRRTPRLGPAHLAGLLLGAYHASRSARSPGCSSRCARAERISPTSQTKGSRSTSPRALGPQALRRAFTRRPYGRGAAHPSVARLASIAVSRSTSGSARRIPTGTHSTGRQRRPHHGIWGTRPPETHSRGPGAGGTAFSRAPTGISRLTWLPEIGSIATFYEHVFSEIGPEISGPSPLERPFRHRQDDDVS